MTKKELEAKYPADRMASFRKLFDEDVKDWAPIAAEAKLDIQCVSTEQGPWPDAEWNARHAIGNERPCLHEDVLTQYIDKVVNKVDMNPMGIEAHPSGDGATEESAEFTENRIRQWEYEEKAQQAYQTAVTNATRSSFGFWELETAWSGKKDQKICCIEIDDPLTVTPGFFKKKDGSDMRRCWKRERMSHAEFRSRFGQKAKITSFDEREIENWTDTSTVWVAVLWHLSEDERELLDIDAPEGRTQAFADEFEDGIKAFEGNIVDRRTVKQCKVLKTLMTGLEVLDEREWIDPGIVIDGYQVSPPEIPVLIVTGRIKYENDGQRVIESLVRKGRVGQLRYDSLISSAQEMISMTPKVKVSGPEGTFDTTTPWDKIHRNPIEYAEWKPMEDAAGRQLPAPQWITYEPPIQAIEIEKQSILIGIQNAIGMASTERKDRAAKSGKALDKLTEEMEVSTAHYFGSLSQAQCRQYRILERCLPLLERDQKEVGIRDKFGKHQMQPVKPEYYNARHSVAVGVGKLYQTQKEKEEETADLLLQTKDPQVLMAVMPGAIRMKIPGAFGDTIADMLEAIQPAPMQAARQAKQNKVPPEVMQAQQQAQQAISALNAHAEDLERKVRQLLMEKEAKVTELTLQKQIHDSDNQVKLEIAEINASVKEDMNTLNQQVAALKHVADVLMGKAQLSSDEQQAGLDRSHASMESEADRTHAAEQGAAERDNQQQLTAAQLDAQQKQAEMAAANQGEA